MKSRTISACILFSLIVLNQSLQSQTFKWGKSAGGAAYDNANDLVADDIDNMYSVGVYTNQATFDGQTLTATGLNSFLIKFDSAGVKQWLLSFPGTLKRITIDPNDRNNLIAGGTFSGTIVIGTTTLTSNGLVDCYIFRFDPNGNIIWATSWGGNGNDELHDIEYQVSGNFTATGSFNSSTVLFKDAVSVNQVYDAGLTESRRAANIYVAHFKHSDGKALLARAKGVIPAFPVAANNPIIRVRLETDMRGRLGFQSLADSLYTGGGGATMIGSTNFPYTFNVLELDSNLNVKRAIYQDRDLYNHYERWTHIFSYTHLDRNGDLFFIKAQRYQDVGGQTPHETSHYEGFGVFNTIDHDYKPYSGVYTCSPFTMYCLEYLPVVFPVANSGNAYSYRVKASVGTNNTYIKGPGWTKPFPQDFDTAVYLYNTLGNKVYMAGYFKTWSTTQPITIDGATFQRFDGKDAFFAVLSVPEQPLKADAGPDRFICAGNIAGVQIGGTPTAIGGAKLPYTYSWQPTTGLNNASIPYPVANPPVTTQYILTLSDGNGNISRDTVKVYVNESSVPTISAEGPTTFCNQQNVRLTASPAERYVWSTGDTTRSILVTVGGSYTVSTTNSCGVTTLSSPIQITVNPNPPIPVITAGGPTTFCIGGSVTLTAPAGYSYLWNTGETTQSVFVNATGGRSVTVTDNNGCSRTSQGTYVQVNPSTFTPVISSNPANSNSFCQGNSFELIVPPAVSGLTYLWSTGQTFSRIRIYNTGSYTVTVSSTAGCGASQTSLPYFVTVNPQPPASITVNGSLNLCGGGTVTLTANAGPGYTYYWNTTATTRSITVSTPGTYRVYVTDPIGCTGTSAPVTVTVGNSPPVPVISASGPTTFCGGGSVILTAPAGFAYLWSTGATTQSINVTSSGNYTVTVTNAGGCSSSSSATTVTVNPQPPVPVITQIGNTLSSSAPTGNQWYFNGTLIPGATAQTYTYTTGGNYFVTVTLTGGCSATSAVFNAFRNSTVTIGANERFHSNLFPNPVTNQLTVEYQLEQPHMVGISLVDMNGNRIVIQNPVLRAAGRYSVNADAIAERMWSGVYILEYTIDNQKVTRTIVKF